MIACSMVAAVLADMPGCGARVSLMSAPPFRSRRRYCTWLGIAGEMDDMTRARRGSRAARPRACRARPTRTWISVSAPIGSMISTAPEIVRSDAAPASVKARGLHPERHSTSFRQRCGRAVDGDLEPLVAESRARASFPLTSASVASIRFICGVPMKLATKTLPGLAKIACGEAICSIRPSRMMAMRSAMVSASSWSWVTITRRLGEAGQHLLDLAAHGLAELDVEAAERLVEEEAVRIAHDGARDRDALLLALGDLSRQAVEDCR